MSHYCRHYQSGGTYFFTVNLYQRISTLPVDYINYHVSTITIILFFSVRYGSFLKEQPVDIPQMPAAAFQIQFKFSGFPACILYKKSAYWFAYERFPYMYTEKEINIV